MTQIYAIYVLELRISLESPWGIIFFVLLNIRGGKFKVGRNSSMKYVNTRAS